MMNVLYKYYKKNNRCVHMCVIMCEFQVIELKRDTVPALVQNNLFKKTGLQTSFSGNMLALMDDGRQPKRITLRTALMEFIAFRFKTVRRRTSFQLGKLQARQHIVQGLLVALEKMDDVSYLLYLRVLCELINMIINFTLYVRIDI